MELSLILQVGIVFGVILVSNSYQSNSAYDDKLWALQHNEDYRSWNHQKDSWKKAPYKPYWKHEVKKTQWQNPASKTRWRQRLSKPSWENSPYNSMDWWNPGQKNQWQNPVTTTHWQPPSGRTPGTLHPGYNKRKWPDYIPPITMVKPRLDDPPEF